MTLPPDLVAFLATLLRGAQLSAQALVIGGLVFTLTLAQPLALRLGRAGAELAALGLRRTALAALTLAGVMAAIIATGLYDLAVTLDIPLAGAIGADFVAWDATLGVAALVVAAGAAGRRTPVMLLGSAAILAASVMSSHAAARVDGRAWAIAADLLHQTGACVWIGGIPFLLAALGRVGGADGRLAVGLRASHTYMAAVALLALGAAMLAVLFIGSVPALIGTAYGAMTLAKAALFAVLLVAGLMNMLAVRRLAGGGGDPTLFNLRRFAEIEVGIGISVLFIAASLASQPPSIDQVQDRATPAELAQRVAPEWPRLVSPSSDQLTRFVDGHAVDAAATEAQDRAWSEFNHHWAGLMVLAIGALALIERHRRGRWARHWPLLFLVLAGMLLVRSDPESWPLGPIGFWERLGDPEVMQHRALTLLIVVFGLFEWAVRTGRMKQDWARLSFPLLCALGGALLLTHNHSLTDIKQRYLIEFTHIPMGLFGLLAGWARWLELRGQGRWARVAGWVWPICFLLVGLLLVDYRET